ncbi:MAG: PA14 domain-containing protein [Anaerolineae bacterium]|jgi:4-amino-4-deoxy-L-arabinose transferase-like glycosyltransferase|nr:PA14 domain-containing protein [Anaerolineae bacterium]MDH7474099.1 PA14 domain-containing protein [Anaerolineae bacterium]
MYTSRKITHLPVALVAVGLAVMAQSHLTRNDLRDGLLIYVVAAALFVMATRSTPATIPSPPRSQITPGGRRLRVGMVLLVVASLISTAALLVFEKPVRPWMPWGLYVSSLLCFFVAIYFLDPLTTTSHPSTLPTLHPSNPPTLYPSILLLAILLLASFFRLYQFNNIPFGTWYDEADGGLHALRVLQDPNYRPVFVPAMDRSAFLVYLFAMALRLFGVSTLALRAVPVAFGLGGVLAAYLFGREFEDERLGLLFAFFIAVSRWHVNFSRIAMTGIDTPFFILLTLYFLLKGGRTGRAWDFAWGGLVLGLSLWFYTTNNFLLIIVALLVMMQAVAVRDYLRRNWANLLLLALAVLLVVAPLARYALRHSDVFWARPRRLSIFRDPTVTDPRAAIIESVKRHVLMFNFQGDRNGRHNLPGAPMLDPISGALFVLGFAYSLWRWRNPRYLLLPVWWVVMLCPAVFALFFESPQALRGIGTLPVVYLMACLPLYALIREFRRLFARWIRLLPIAVGALLVVVGWYNFDFYFHKQANDFAVWNAFSTPETLMARQIQRWQDDYDLRFSPVLTGHPTIRFLAPELGEMVPFNPATVFPLRSPGEDKEGIMLFVDPDSRAVRQQLMRYYPNAVVEELGHAGTGFTVLYTYRLSRETIASVQGLAGQYFALAGASRQLASAVEGPVLSEIEGPLDFDWTTHTPVPLPFRVQWRGVLLAPEYGRYTLALDTPGPAEVLLDGESLLRGDGELSRVVVLAQGCHDLEIHCEVLSGGLLRLRWRPPGAGELTVIPADALFHVPVSANGLLGRFYPNDNWSGPPAFTRIDAQIAYYFHFLPMPRPYTVEWAGQLDVPEAGDYILTTESLSASWLYLDGELLIENTTPNREISRTIQLDAGRHDLKLRFLDAGDRSHIYLYWTPPGGIREFIPQERLFPYPGAGWSNAAEEGQ